MPQIGGNTGSAEPGLREALVAHSEGALRERLAGSLRRRGFAVREVATGPEALAAVGARPPDLVIAEVELPGASGFELCRLLQDGARTQVLLVSGTPLDGRDRVAGLLVGAGQAYEPMPAEELVERVVEAEAAPAEALTRREREVLGLLAEGLEQAHIARRLVLSEKTVANHLDRLRAKLGVRTRAQAVAVAYRDHLLGARRLAGDRADAAALRSPRE